MAAGTDPTLQLLRSWNEETDFAKRNVILQQMTEKGLFPQDAEDRLEQESGLYPDLPDPFSKLYNHRFLEKLLRKQEFLENRQTSILSQFEEGDQEQDLMALLESDASACGAYKPGEKESIDDTPAVTPFELSPTQRFIGRFLSPKTPYNSALLFHGVGVGKTCSGITVAENFLEMFPRKVVYIVAPPTIQAGWMREIFNLRKLTLGKKDAEPNVHNGCTGNTYLRLAAMEYERDPEVIKKKITDVIKRRYKIMGYLQFYNHVMKYLDRNISKEIKGERYAQEKRRFLSKKFSGGLLIVDEAHNLRDKETEVISVKVSEAEVEAEAEEVEVEAEEVEAEAEAEVEAEVEAESNEEENFVNLSEIDLPQEGGAEEENTNDEENEKNIALQEVFAGEDSDAPLAAEDKSDIIKGKKVTPLLRELLQAADGMKFLMLTATPMYNEYREIILLLNLLLLNDKRATIRESQVFQPNGSFQEGGRELLGRIAGSYVSFMRGENPLAFPIRLDPLLQENQKVTVWPSRQPNGAPIDESQRRAVINLPYVACAVPGENVRAFQALCESIISQEKLSIPSTDKLIMAGNFLYPGSDDSMDVESLKRKMGKTGFRGSFTIAEKSPLVFEPDPSTEPRWMLSKYEDYEPLEFHSPKAKYIIDRVQTTQGVSFVYSRFVETGALTLALLLEANGYTCANRKPLLKLSESLDDRGRQCALCPLREADHKEHEFEPKGFVPAKYVLLTGEKDYSPNNKAAIELATDPDNFDGKKVKVILGSTIASEGIDLKFIREIFVFDSWYHLSKLEQVIGRGIRYKSHCALPPLQRNCTINLLVLSYPERDNLETIDMYQYRNGFLKARQVGEVTRVLKEYALDCNLNKELILIQKLNPIQQIDGQGVLREDVDINDTPYTNICDWLETCEYRCKPDDPEINLDALEEEIDYSTYDEYAARWREHDIKRALRKFFEDQPFLHFDDIQNKVLANVPRVAKAAILEEIVGNRSFRIRVGNQEGYIIYKNGFYLFQPEMLWDTNLPIALRIQDFPVKRDMYEPRVLEKAVPKPKAVAVKEVQEASEKEEIVENEEEEEVQTLSQYKVFWEEIVKWSKSLAAGSATKETPRAINIILESRYVALGKKTTDTIQRMFEMVGRLYMSVRSKEALRKKLADVLIEYIWDEFLTNDEIQMIYKMDTPEAKEAARENTVLLGSKLLFRYVDAREKKIVYICDGKPCEKSVIDAAEAEDPISQLKADRTTTAPLYGHNAPKDGKILFKSNDAVEVGKKPGIGRLCYSVPNTKVHYELLDRISKLAAAIPDVNSDLDLSKEKTVAIETPARLCTLADLAFRLLDKVSSGRRYFYRPVSALKTKHEGKGSK